MSDAGHSRSTPTHTVDSSKLTTRAASVTGRPRYGCGITQGEPILRGAVSIEEADLLGDQRNALDVVIPKVAHRITH